MSELKEFKIEERLSSDIKLSGLAKDFNEFITNNKANLSGSDLSGTKIYPFSYRNISIILPENSKVEFVNYSEIIIKIGCKEKNYKRMGYMVFW